ncbi:DNA-directed RNA polymerase sigma-70 factor (plasmid) [Persicobacter psychrovividus]|uniref:DNA-directed RNA polymerase sigma-70 factor n=1 Tax=Persicobacter psychrovividus TaxID=387638 RepID=A0ABM7VIS8_9BACT|nr:DNA-directed RNA polymerase sigma-70 factor [Persicobacter psychrovividus]
MRQQDPDNENLLLFLKGDIKAYETIFRAYYEPLCQFSMRYLADPQQSEEVVQELFTTLWEKRASLNISTSLKSYLFGATRNNCLQLIRKQKVRDKYQNEVAAMHQNQHFEDLDVMVELELSEKIQQIIAQLPDQRRKIFMMSRFEGKKYQEIADELGLSVKTIENQMSSALKSLRLALHEYLPLLLFIIWQQYKK